MTKRDTNILDFVTKPSRGRNQIVSHSEYWPHLDSLDFVDNYVKNKQGAKVEFFCDLGSGSSIFQFVFIAVPFAVGDGEVGTALGKLSRDVIGSGGHGRKSCMFSLSLRGSTWARGPGGTTLQSGAPGGSSRWERRTPNTDPSLSTHLADKNEAPLGQQEIGNWYMLIRFCFIVYSRT